MREGLTMFELMQQLCAVPAVSGREEAMAEKVLELITPYCDEAHIDRVGDVIGFIRGAGAKKKKILYSAHMDEVGFIVTKIDDSGYVRFTNSGGPNMTSAAYREVIFPSGLHGMCVPPTFGDGNLNTNAMVIDIGAKNKAEAEEKVHVGDFFALKPGICRMSGTTVGGRPVDDRVGCAIEIKAAEEIFKRGSRPYNDTYFAFSVQEEVTALGGTSVYQEVRPDFGLAVDVCGVGDTYGSNPMACRVGDGTAILVRDTTLMADKHLVDDMTAACEENGIKYQYEVSTAGGTDAVPMQRAGLGCRAGVISIPMRYLHTSAEVMDLFDAEECKRLILALCDREMD